MEAEKDSGRRLVCSFFFFFSKSVSGNDRSIFFLLLLFLAAFSFLFCILQEDRKKYNKLHAKGSKQLTPPVPCEAQSLRHLSGEVVAGKGVERG